MRMNEAFKALADPTRREILALLRGGEMTAGELAERLGKKMTKPSVSHHFGVLKQHMIESTGFKILLQFDEPAYGVVLARSGQARQDTIPPGVINEVI